VIVIDDIQEVDDEIRVRGRRLYRGAHGTDRIAEDGGGAAEGRDGGVEGSDSLPSQRRPNICLQEQPRHRDGEILVRRR
jgi:hypothetical protein